MQICYIYIGINIRTQLSKISRSFKMYKGDFHTQKFLAILFGILNPSAWADQRNRKGR